MSKTKTLVELLRNDGDDYANQFHLEALRQEEEWLNFVNELELESNGNN